MNPNTNHTPGPWRVANGRIYSRAYQTALDLRLFVICDLDMGNDPRGEQESNARLIAAAPELLTIAVAYQNLLRTSASTDGEIATFHHIESVILKATQSHEPEH